MGDPGEFAGRRVVVMGLGRFGGGVGVTRFLADRGADILVTDLDPADKLTKSLAEIQDLIDSGRVSLRLGEHNISDFTTCDLLVVNPAVKPGNRFVRAAEAAGIEVTTEMRLLVQRLPNRQRTIGVTGSAGKSTVTAMIGHVLDKVFRAGPQGPGSPRVWVGGNIGVSLLPVIDQIGSEDWVVLELSSFMLERLKKDDHFPGWSPHIAVITNISPNHLDWHGSMEAYVDAKRILFKFQMAQDQAIAGNAAAELFQGGLLQKGVQLKIAYPYHIDPIPHLPGEHNQVNAALSIHVVSCVAGDANLGLDMGQIKDNAGQLLSDFIGLPHRLHLITDHNGVRYYNDSKSTTPESTKIAIQAFSDRDSVRIIHVILGGYVKGSDYQSLAMFANQHCKSVYTIGTSGDGIADLCEDAASRSVPDRPSTCGGVSWPAASAEVVRCGELETAVTEIQKRVEPGDVVLLSPACASWDQFENYEQRGERFIELVRQHTTDSD